MLENINSLKDFYEYIDSLDLENKNFHIRGDLIKIRENFNKLGLVHEIKKVQWEIDFFVISDRNAEIRPESTWLNEQGEEICLPDYKNFSESVFEYLNERIKTCKNSLFKAKYGLILWHLRRDFSALKITIDSYLALVNYFIELEIKENGEHNGLYLAQNIKKALILSLKTGKAAYKLEEVKAKMKYLLNEYTPQEKNVHILNAIIIDTMIESERFFAPEDFEVLPSICWKLATLNKSLSFTESFLDRGYKIDKIIKKTSYEWLRKKAELYEELMNQNKNNIAAPKFCMDALSLYKEIKDTKKISELEYLYPELCKNIQLNGISTQKLFDFKAILLEQNQILEQLKSADEFIAFLINNDYFIKCTSGFKEIKTDEILIFASLIDTQIIDDRGHIKKEVDGKTLAFNQKYSIYIQVQAYCLAMLIKEASIQDKFNLNFLISYLQQKTWLKCIFSKNDLEGGESSYCWLSQVYPPLACFFDYLNLSMLKPQSQLA